MRNQGSRWPVLVGSLVWLLTAAATPAAGLTVQWSQVGREGVGRRPTAVRTLQLTYRAHDGSARNAYVRVPAWYGPTDDPPLPLVISPHGRGVSAKANCDHWGSLPAIGRFAVICPEGRGTRLRSYSWGAPGQIADLGRMPQIIRETLPWLQIERHRIYAVGGSMGGQEVLLLVARYPHRLAGAIAFDSIANLARQYYELPSLRCDRVCRHRWREPIGFAFQRLEKREVGGTPSTDPAAYAQRSPLHYARQIAFSGVPLELWWSKSDLIVPDQQHHQSGALFARIRRLNPHAPVEAFFGYWRHSHEERATSRLPFALAQLGLLAARYRDRSYGLHELHFLPQRDLACAATRHTTGDPRRTCPLPARQSSSAAS